jgi:hypothetical protein
MTIGTLQTIGYTEPDALGRVDTFVAQPRAYLVDIRFKPWRKWNPRWNRNALQARYPKRYVHLPGLGNVNYGHRDQPIQLADPEQHLAHLVDMLTHGTSYLLLCACKDYEQCHRKVVYDLLLATLGQLPAPVTREALVAVSLWD